MSAAVIMTALLIIFIIIWMSLTFTNQFCTGAAGFGLCYKTECPVCLMSPASAPAPGAVA